MSNKENKEGDGFGKGITLIIVGVIALLVTFFEVEIDWYVVGRLWPLILIIIGICIMPVNRWVRTILATVLIIVGFIAYQSKVCDEKHIDKTEIISSFSDDDDDDF